MNIEERRRLARDLSVEISEDGFFKVPNGVSRLKIDVGLSFSAPHLISWISSDPELLVIGIEPLLENIENVRRLVLGLGEGFSERVVLVRAAAGSSPGQQGFYVTTDKGQASLKVPLLHEVQREETVLVETIDRISSLIPWERFSRIDFLKTDCQGGDFDALLGAQNTLLRTAVVTFEDPTNAYETHDYASSAETFLTQLGFTHVNKRPTFLPKDLGKVGRLLSSSGLVRSLAHKVANFRSQRHGSGIITLDPTFLNQRFSEEIRLGKITAHQFN